MDYRSTPHKITDYLRIILEEAALDKVMTIGHLLTLVGRHGFYLLLLLLAVLNLAIFMVPLASLFFGLPMLIVATQILIGKKSPVLPDALLDKTVQSKRLLRPLKWAIIALNKVEEYIKPRALFLSHPHLDRIHGLSCLVLAIMVTLPIPLFNMLPSVAVTLIALGMLERDGLFVILGYGIGGWCIVLFRSLGHAIHHLLS